MAKTRNFIVQSLMDRRFDVFFEVVSSMTPSARQFWREKLSFLVNSKELWTPLVSSGFFPPVHLLWALFIEHFNCDLSATNNTQINEFLRTIYYFFSLYEIDASEFVAPVLGLSLVGLLCKANIPFLESIDILLKTKVIYYSILKGSGRKDGTKKPICRNSSLMLDSLEKETRYAPLYYAIISDDFEMLRLLVDLGSDINALDRYMLLSPSLLFSLFPSFSHSFPSLLALSLF